MLDPREILKNRLIGLGIDEHNSTIIALDAGSSQCIVNEDYLIELDISDKYIKSAIHEIVLFYMGELLDNEYNN